MISTEVLVLPKDEMFDNRLYKSKNGCSIHGSDTIETVVHVNTIDKQ